MEKMTHKDMYAHIAEVMADDAAVVEFCEKMIEQINARKPKVNKEAMEFAEEVYEYMVGEGTTMFRNKDVKEHFEVSAQKSAAALRRLVADGRVLRFEDAGPEVMFSVATGGDLA